MENGSSLLGHVDARDAALAGATTVRCGVVAVGVATTAAAVAGVC